MMNFTISSNRFSLVSGSIFSLAMLLVTPCHAEKEAIPVDFKQNPEITKILYENCLACHDEYEQKGDIRFDHLGKIDLDTRLNILNKMQEQLHFKHMPPKDEKIQPTVAERSTVLKWVGEELKKHNASKLEEKLSMPDYANYVDHEDLFSGKYKHLKPFTPDRQWLISEFIFDAKFNDLLGRQGTKNIDGKRQSVSGNNTDSRFDLTNPFLLPTNSGVRYYANTTLNGGHLLTMLTNAKNASSYITNHLAKRDRNYIPAFNEIMDLEYKHENILKARKKLLDHFIERILVETYGDKHQALLPVFESVAPERPSAEDVMNENKPAINYSGVGRDELELIFLTMRKFGNNYVADDELIQKCEKDWFYNGDGAREITMRIKFLHYYKKEWVDWNKQYNHEKKWKLPVYKPLSDEEMKTIKDTILKFREKGDTYQIITKKCMAHWKQEFKEERENSGVLDDKLLGELVSQSFLKIHERLPTEDESSKYIPLTRSYITKLGNLKGIQKLFQTLILRSDFVYRQEHGEGEADEHGRRMLSPYNASYALSYALTDSNPDKELRKAVKTGKLNTREDYKREVLRMLKSDQSSIIDTALDQRNAASITDLPIRKLRFFREFFGYPNLLSIFKDEKRFGGKYDDAKIRLVEEADRLVEHILKEDKDVIETLLNTEDFYVYHSGDDEAMTEDAETIRKIYDYFKDKGWEEFEPQDLAKHKAFLEEVKLRGIDVKNLDDSKNKRSVDALKRSMKSFAERFAKGHALVAPYNSYPSHGAGNAQTRTGNYLGSPEVAKFFNIALDDWNYPSAQPAKMQHRKGMLTHPAWLIAHALNTETDPVIRGKWIREKLLAGTVPDIPITVEAVVPEDHHNTLRTRLAKVTEKKYCWKCHEYMNPLGYAFEMYDDFGRFRTEESIEHPENLIKEIPSKGQPHEDLRDIYKTLPVVSNGSLEGTGDKNLDGKVKDAIDLADRLSRSDKVRQSVIRHAFRYFMGRNEVLSDSQTLIDADKAYLESGGSFDAVIVSLLTSDSFIYRKPNTLTENKN
jgi:hypothetical protein